MDKELIAIIEIPQYIRKVMTTKSRRANYYEEGESIPQKYLAGLDITHHYIPVGNKELLADMEGNLVIKNPKTNGTSKYKMINGQDLHTLTMKTYERSKIMLSLKEQFKPYILQLQPISKDFYPLKVRLDFYNDEKGYDLDNYSIFYVKAFLDCLVDCKIIEDDNIEVINSLAFNFIRCIDLKLVVKLFKDKK